MHYSFYWLVCFVFGVAYLNKDEDEKNKTQIIGSIWFAASIIVLAMGASQSNQT